MTISAPSQDMPRQPSLVFMGSPDFSVPSLAALHQTFSVQAVFTQPPRKAGRGMKLRPTAVARFAEEHKLPCFWPEKLRGNDEAVNKIAAYKPDIIIVIAYGLLLPQSVLDVPRLGCVNGHASLLPRWRGAAPIHRAIEAGDSMTGVTIMQMEKGLDTGPMLMHEKIAITPDMTTGNLTEKLAELTAELMVKAVRDLLAGEVEPISQPEIGVSYAQKISTSESLLSFQHPAAELARKIRAFNPFPGLRVETISGRLKLLSAEVVDEQTTREPAGTFLGKGKDESFLVACADKSILAVHIVQAAGKKQMSGSAFLNGQNWREGQLIQG